MAGFLYATPGTRGEPAADLIRELKLEYAFEGEAIAVQLGRLGPGGGPATILAEPDLFAGHEIGYYSEPTQRWVKRHSRFGPECWVGCFTGAGVPTPRDLLRDSFHDSLRLKLGDGNEWLIPSAPAMPRPMVIDENGQWAPGPLQGRALELSELAKEFVGKAMEAMAKAAEGEPARVEFRLSISDEEAACRFLQANYRLAETEAAMLGLFYSTGPSKANEVLVMGSDWDQVVQFFKKKTETSAT